MKLLTNLEDLSKTLYNDPYAVDTKKMARELIKALNDNLKALYQQLEDRDDFDGVDLYQVGDLINLLDGLKIEVIDAERADW